MSEIIVQKDETFLKEFETALNLNQNLTEWELFQLNYEVKKATLAKEFSSLQALSYSDPFYSGLEPGFGRA